MTARRDPLFGVGINDSDTPVYKTGKVEGKKKILWICPFYKRWSDMLKRCYYVKYKDDAYFGDKYVCDEWLYFSRFKLWMETQDWEGKHLDKDLLIPGNKIYGPEACVFVDPRVNTFVIECNSNRGEWPVGVSYIESRNKFRASCSENLTGKKKTIGHFKTPEEAHAAWLEFKLDQAKVLASMQTDVRVAKALVYRYENYATIMEIINGNQK